MITFILKTHPSEGFQKNGSWKHGILLKMVDLRLKLQMEIVD